MKKLTTLVLAAGLVVSSFAGSASAGEFKPFAQFAEEFTYGDAGNYQAGSMGTTGAENFGAATRIRFGFDYIQSEDLSATMMFQYGNHNWGSSKTGDAKSFDEIVQQDKSGPDFTRDPDANLRMRLAYIDWTIPTTDVKVRMGRQAVVAPSYAFGSAILDGRADAVSINGNVNDNISLGASWMRISNEEQSHNDQDEADAIMLQAEFAYDGWKLAPWAMYTVQRHNSLMDIGMSEGIRYNQTNNKYYKHPADAYVLGASFELSMFDPFVFAIDALYNRISYFDSDKYPIEKFDKDLDGFYVGLSASYKLNNGTVALKGWYATGDDDTETGDKWNNDNGFVLLDGGFGATTMLFGDNIIGADGYNTLTGDSPFGTWGIVAEYAGFSFMDKLTHTARIAYVQGTNEYESTIKRYANELNYRWLTEDDSIIEIDFNSTYEIYQNLSATLELGYMFVDMDNLVAGTEDADDVMRAALTFVYNF